MGRSRSTKTLIAMLPYLHGLQSNEPEVHWQVPTNGTKRWAERIREAIAIALDNPDSAPGLALHGKKYMIKEYPKLNKVVALHKLVPVVSTLDPISVQVPAAPPAAAVQSRTLVPTSISGKQTARGIIGSLLNSSAVSNPIHYPDADLSSEDEVLLKRWADAQIPLLMILITPPAGVTIAPWDPNFAED